MRCNDHRSPPRARACTFLRPRGASMATHVKPSLIEPFPEIGSPGRRGNHIVQFYEDAGFLAKTVADFVGAGFAADQPAIIIATPEHREAIVDRLSRHGVDVLASRQSGILTLLDAAETLDQFLVNGMPDRDRFRKTIG